MREFIFRVNKIQVSDVKSMRIQFKRKITMINNDCVTEIFHEIVRKS